MFNDPAASSAFLEPGKYLGKVVELEETPPSLQHPEWGAGIKWIWNLAEQGANGAWVLKTQTDAAGQPTDVPYPFWQFSSAKLTPGSKARPWIEALLGRKLIDGQDKGADLAAQIIGAKAILMIGPQAQKDGTIKQDCILSASPFKATAKAAPAKASAAVAALEDDLPAEQRSGSVAVAERDEDDSPPAF